MNRRRFLAGLLATTAAVPLAKAAPFTGSMDSAGVDLVTAMDLASATDYSVIHFSNPVDRGWVGLRFAAADHGPMKYKGFAVFDEASYISESAWEYLTGKKLDDVLAAQAAGKDWRTVVKFGARLEAVYGDVVCAQFTRDALKAMVPATTEAPQHEPNGSDPGSTDPRAERAGGDRLPRNS